MKVLLSSIGSRGDVQPMLALALELRTLGHTARFCAPPNFKAWIESYGFEFFPIGPDVREMAQAPGPTTFVMPTPEQRKLLAAGTVRAQFEVVGRAARACDRLIACGVLQIAAPSIAQLQGIPSVFVSYAPVSLPSPDHPPPKMDPGHPQDLTGDENLALWKAEEENWNGLFGEALNEERAKAGLGSVDNVLSHVITGRPWLAADSLLGPAPSVTGLDIVTTGAWMVSEETPLPDALESFLAAGDPPVYLGFGSMRGAEQAAPILIEAVRAVGRRAIVSEGWGKLKPIDAQADCIAIGDVNHAKLFRRVAAVVHHGGAGTTHAAAAAGAPQVIVPHHYDQPYWARRVHALRIGIASPPREELKLEAIVAALIEATGDLHANARAFSSRMSRTGTRMAIELLCHTG